MYYSSKLDHIEKGHTGCTRHLAALKKAIEKNAHVVMCHELKVNTEHGVLAYLTSSAFTMTAGRQAKISKILQQPHITFSYESINMADGLHVNLQEPHNCAEIARTDLKVRMDLETEPLDNPELTLFTDGSCHKGEEGNVAAYSIIQQQGKRHSTVAAEIIPQPASAQLAEVMALTIALEYAKGKSVNIYTDSAYAYGAVHVDGPQW